MGARLKVNAETVGETKVFLIGKIQPFISNIYFQSNIVLSILSR